MKRMILIISSILVLVTALIIYFSTQSSRLNISSKEKLSKYLGIDFKAEIKIDNINWKYTSKGGTEIYLKVRVDKNYTKEVSYFKDNNRMERRKLYSNIEKELRSTGFNIDKVVYDNIIYKEISERKFLEVTNKPYNVSVYAVGEQQNEEFSEFIIHTIIPSKVNINKEKLIK